MAATSSRFPILYLLNTRVYLTDLGRTLGHRACINDIPDSELDQWVKLGCQWVWLLSVWQTGLKGQQISRTNEEWLREFRSTLPDLREDDIQGSGFAIKSYQVSTELGGEEALQQFRRRLQSRGLKLMLDFVPNHVAIDHPWVDQHPDFFIEGTEDLLQSEPSNYLRVRTAAGEKILAHGRDPYFPGWPDTLQLNYANPALREAMKEEMMNIASKCDGVRCDMAMLLLPDVFERTWKRSLPNFWSQAIQGVRNHHPDFAFMAEVYWDLEWVLQQQGFDYTYDKRLYDRLKENRPKLVREHFFADPDFQAHSARFLENHDEPRAAQEFTLGQHEAAAIITFFCQGLRMFHQGQLEGRKKKISPHLNRAPFESVDAYISGFYIKLLVVLKQEIFHAGEWKLALPTPVADGNSSFENYLGFGWSLSNEKILVVVNYSPSASQCFLNLPFDDLAGKQWTLMDQFTGVSYFRSGDELQSKGLFLDEPGWKYYVFSLTR